MNDLLSELYTPIVFAISIFAILVILVLWLNEKFEDE
jgi:hypothetical protein